MLMGMVSLSHGKFQTDVRHHITTGWLRVPTRCRHVEKKNSGRSLPGMEIQMNGNEIGSNAGKWNTREEKTSIGKSDSKKCRESHCYRADDTQYDV